MSKTTYPPYNIIELPSASNDNETSYIIEIAAAGMNMDKVEITCLDGSLKVEYCPEKPAGDPSDTIYLHRGISQRGFRNVWTLAENVEVLSAIYEDGILSIGMKRVVPEEQKPKTIPITRK
tara:strand:- start:2096 stop:2458 length:363 start_codon:yes stop_codon:yes gene_type:complete